MLVFIARIWSVRLLISSVVLLTCRSASRRAESRRDAMFRNASASAPACRRTSWRTVADTGASASRANES